MIPCGRMKVKWMTGTRREFSFSRDNNEGNNIWVDIPAVSINVLVAVKIIINKGQKEGKTSVSNCVCAFFYLLLNIVFHIHSIVFLNKEKRNRNIIFMIHTVEMGSPTIKQKYTITIKKQEVVSLLLYLLLLFHVNIYLFFFHWLINCIAQMGEQTYKNEVKKMSKAIYYYYYDYMLLFIYYIFLMSSFMIRRMWGGWGSICHCM